MDVHPPLAKLLITLAGWVAGFNGDFDFKDIGKDYVEPGVPYVAMRLLPALLGVMTIPMMFLTLKATGCQTLTASMGALLLIFGKGVDLVESQRADPCRKWTLDPITPHSPRLASGRHDCFHCNVLYLFHEPARAGSIKSL